MKKILYLGLDPSRYLHDGELVHLPLIRTQPRSFEGEVKKAFECLHTYTHIVFTSRTAVPIYITYALNAGFSEATLKEKHYLCIGKATAQCVTDAGLDVSHKADEETAEGVIDLLKTLTLDGHLFFPRSAQGRSLIPDFLTTHHIPSTTLDLYDTLPNTVSLPNLDLFDAIVFTSPSTVQAFYQLTGTLPPAEKCIPIGPITENYLTTFRID